MKTTLRYIAYSVLAPQEQMKKKRGVWIDSRQLDSLDRKQREKEMPLEKCKKVPDTEKENPWSTSIFRSQGMQNEPESWFINLS